jgi:hypothetical protein
MASMAAAQRRGAARAAAKQRRQTIFLIALAAVLAALLAYELPHVLKRSEGSSPATASAVPAPPVSHLGGKARLGGTGTGGDPFAAKPLPNQDPRAVTGGGPDPFKGGARAVPAAPQPIPQQIVIGRPGGHRVAKRGWIVILASIPTGNGRSSAEHFAGRARGSVGGLSILNSSHSRPLRGGYWVVYSGPYASLSTASQHAGRIHAAGYGSAYLRELIRYR